ncbi:MAG TPA: serine hydrolase domain-containing protein [Thermoanaerobaculia bacterium]|nr:serine hydrolase domain-containing protein [Thermoanaerobaculia bacterium]
MFIRRLIVLGLLLSSACAHRSSAFRDLDAAIEKELANAIPSIAVAVARNGSIVHQAAFGFADAEASRRATVSTPYPLASVTKPLVATGMMVLAERKRVDLDLPAHQYAGGRVQPTERYTLRQLLNHTAGLPTYATIRWSGEASPSHDAATMFHRYGFAAHPPGTVSEYSNIGYGLVGHIIAEQSGQSLATFLEREVFRPLGMRNTMMLESAAVPPGVARKYDASGKALPETFNDTPGAGNIYASVHDLVRFGMFHLDDRPSRVLSRAAKEAMRSYVEPGALYPYYDSSRYGLGWYFRTTANGTRVVWHEGGMPGASSILVLLPDQKIVAAVLINANDRNDVAQSIANRLIASVEPAMQPLTFVPTDGFVAYDAQPAYLGRWEGALTVDGRALRCTMTFDAGGKVTVAFPDRAADDFLPRHSTFNALVNGDLLLGTIAGTLPGSDIAQKPGGYVLLRLVRRGDQLSGTMIAYASPEGLRHLYPFAVSLRRVHAAR